MTGRTNGRDQAGGYIERHKAARILTRDGNTCYICGHPGADQVDHIIPWAEWTRADLSVHDQSNLAAIHGEACPVCDAHCHDDKTAAEATRGTKRRAALRKRPPQRHPGAL